MLFCQIGLESVVLWSEDYGAFSLFRKDIDQKFGQILVNIYRESPFNSIYLINGPGSFTTLRVCTLALNIFKMNNQSISLYDINSINFYSRVREIETHIPPYGLIRIGQKHKYCFYNFKNNTRNLISVEDIREKNIDSYFVEPTPKLSGFAANFLMVLPNNKGLEILYKHHKTKIARNALFSYAILKKYVSPRYLVTPSISKSNRSWGFA